MILTDEQYAIVEAEAELLVVRAFAGAGKTSTLVAFAKRRPKAKMLYLVLNKTVQVEAEQKFSGTQVKPVTSHGLAFRQCGVQYQHKLVGGIKPYEVEKALQISNELSREIGYSANFNDNMVIASLMLETLNKFLYSTDREIKIKHVPEHSKRLEKTFGGLGMDESAIQQMLVILVRRLWDKMIDPRDLSVGMLHDGYLKLYQLSDPVLSQYEYIKADEFQDINPVSMSIIFRQTAKKVLVGDEHQAIYGWRGARNALGFALKQGGVNRYLTGSFRFGPNIAYVANRILAIKGETIPVQGLSGQDWIGKIADSESRTIISRSNAGVFAQTAQAMGDNKSWWHVGGSEGYRFDQILDIYFLWKRRPDLVRDPFIRTFDDFTELRFYVEEVGDAEIKPRCRIVEDYGDAIPDIIDKIKRKAGAACAMESADRVMSTAHKAKGLEWPNVQVSDDYIELCELPDMSRLNAAAKAKALKLIAEELNILYVAVTRAQKVLQLNFDLLMYLRA
ncbi:MAG: UvrD-helicase domain-containing protein [Methylobacter sp.]